MSKAKSKSAPPASARRIELVALADVQGAARNSKEHDLGAILGSVSRFGYVEPMTMDERTGRLVAGHGRLETLRAMQRDGQAPPDGVTLADDGSWLVPVTRGWSSRTDAEAEAYLIASNRTTELGGWDETALAEVLRELATSGDLVGSGYDGDDVDRMLQAMADEVLDTSSQLGGLEYRVVVECKDEQQQAALIERLESEGYSVKALMS